MCAAPGSKTFQILEMLHAGGADVRPAGLVIANDADAQRCNLLSHQTKRIASPCLLVTNHEGQIFPNITIGGAGQVSSFSIRAPPPPPPPMSPPAS